MLYKLLQETPTWLFSATVHGWVHPVMNTFTVHNDTPEAHIDLDLSADYRLRFTPVNSTGQPLELFEIAGPPTVVAGKRITRAVFADIDGIPQFNLQMGPSYVRTGVRAVEGSLQLPVTWRVNESHEGLWRSWYSRVVGDERVSDVKPLLY